MCGIALTVEQKNPVESSRRSVERMLSSIRHRGPDGHGIRSFGKAVLGHQRLAVVDLSESSNQPMTSQSGRCSIIFNGEIYNHNELRRELISLGRAFATRSDTEVILAAYEQWGKDCFDRFRGMWGLVIHDAACNELILSRDRFGIKPLYYLIDDQRFAVASEIKALLAAYPQYRQADENQVRRFLQTGSVIHSDSTFFKNVFSMLPASIGTYQLDRGELTFNKFWELDGSQQLEISDNQAVVQMKELLTSSVDEHLQADVSVGTCLSGGIDSSAIVCFASQLRKNSLRTFSSFYHDKGFDEREFIDVVNAHAGTQALVFDAAPGDEFMSDLRAIGWFQEVPTAGPGLYSQYRVMAEASHHVKVLLDGQGGDEIFGGYLPYFAERCLDLRGSQDWLDWVKAYKTMFDVSTEWQFSYVERALPHYFRKSAATLRRWFSRNTSSKIVSSSLTSRAIDAGKIEVPRKFDSFLNQKMFQQLCYESIPQLLHYEDRNSMAFSIEARVPLLDHRIVELAFTLPSSMKIRGTSTKWLLREASKQVLPMEIYSRRSKMGYATPFSHWLREKDIRDQVSSYLFSGTLEKRELVDIVELKSLWQTHQEGGGDCSWAIWRILSLEIWYRQFIDDWVPEVPPKRS